MVSGDEYFGLSKIYNHFIYNPHKLFSSLKENCLPYLIRSPTKQLVIFFPSKPDLHIFDSISFTSDVLKYERES